MSERGKVIVTGGSGLIGSALTAELAGAGYEVVVLSRHPEAVRGLPDGARAVGWDGETVTGWGAEVEGAQGVVSLAGAGIGERRWTKKRKRVLRVSRTRSTRAVVQTVQRAASRPAVLLQMSGIDYYGDHPEDERITEEAPPGTGFLADLTQDWEEASRPVEAVGVRRCLLRTSMVLAADGGALPRLTLPFKLFFGGPAGSGSQWVPWIHLRDEVRAIRFLLETEEARGPFNLTAPEPVTNRELSRTLGEVLGRPSLVRAPAAALRLALGEMAEMVLAGRRAVPYRLLEAGFAFEFETLRAALGDLL